MYTGISVWAFPSDWPLERVFALAVEAGFESIELAYARTGPITPETTVEELAAIRSLAAGAGLRISSVASGIFWEVNLLSDDDATRAEALVHLRNMLHVASVLQVASILVVPGFVGPFESGAPVIKDYMVTYERAIADFKSVAPRAEELGIGIGIENVWNKFLSSPLEMRAFLDAVGSPAVGVYLDVANSLRTGYAEHWVKILGQYLKGVHFKDFRTNVGTLQGFVDLFEGDVDFALVMQALSEVEYQGACVVEVFARPQFPEMVVLRAGADMRRIFSR